MRFLLCLFTMPFLIGGCGTSRVIPAAEMNLEAAQAAAKAKTPAVQEKVWNGVWLELGVEGELVSPGKAKLKGTELVVSIVTTGWSSFDTPKGESRSGWADLRFMLNGEMKNVRIEEEDYGYAHGYRIDVSYAYEKWDEVRSLYDPHVKMTITRESP